ncbi:MAG: hypothetical protein PHP95_14245 [Desulfuromonadaceae bacterium]|nr:hypothetical protein [Desulfuromonadaceae bacterium]MDD2849609.1 hypothetical protein [Desulfuromonadaceae bacterium]MDD4130932.1 hypothetical protein [Desulfuromonadaceae bacterium]
MEPITLCGAVILAVGLWVEFEPTIRKAARAVSNSTIMTAIMSSPTAQKPLYVKYMTDSGR